MEEWPPIKRVAANKLNKQSRTADEGWSSDLGVCEVLTNPPFKKNCVKKHSHVGCLTWRQNSLACGAYG